MTFANKQEGRKRGSGPQKESPPATQQSPEAAPNSALPQYTLGQNVPALGAAPVEGEAAEAVAPETPSASNAGEGQPLEAGVRHPLEQFLQRPLDRVRVHTGPDSREAAESHGAYALTYGQDIHLGDRGQSLQGSQRTALLAHEATHTAQQGEASSPAVQLSSLTPDAEDSPQERQAEGLSSAFVAHQSGDSAGLAIRDSIGLRPLASSRPQLAPVTTHFGEFEDYKFNDVKDAAGTSVGVQMYLKFNPGTNVDARKIGLTQAAEGKDAGVQDVGEIRGERQATSGPGVGYFIDRMEGRPSPLYGTSGTVTSGADATKLGSYAAPGITALTPARKAALGFTGLDYGGGSVYGYRYMEGGALKGPVPAEMHDFAHLPVSNSSEQIFETTALAFEGNMAGTYLGSVEWGWRRDAKGAFSEVPLTLKSMGTPTANFLTAANIWKTTKENYGRIANVNPTNIMKMDGTVDFTVPQGTAMRDTGVGHDAAGNTFYRVDIVDGTGRSGLVHDTDTRMGTFGRDTVPLPVPEIYTVNVAGGTVLDGETKCSPNDPVLPQGTRVQSLGPYAALPGYVRVEVADGPYTGRRGIIRQSYLTREMLGTH